MWLLPDASSTSRIPPNVVFSREGQRLGCASPCPSCPCMPLPTAHAAYPSPVMKIVCVSPHTTAITLGLVCAGATQVVLCRRLPYKCSFNWLCPRVPPYLATPQREVQSLKGSWVGTRLQKPCRASHSVSPISVRVLRTCRRCLFTLVPTGCRLGPACEQNARLAKQRATEGLFA